MRDVSRDSTKLLTEKLALSCELASLGPEIEHLRSQASSHQALVAEKLSLQRQLNILKVELETEKRTLHHVLAKERSRSEDDITLKEKLEDLRSELAKEQHERRLAAREAENQNAILKNQAESAQHRLRLVKERQKGNNRELPTTQGEAARNCNATASAHEYLRDSRKRGLAHVAMDATFGTPGNSRVPKKQKGLTFGDKSSFSITPYLSRTTSLAPEVLSERQRAIEARGLTNLRGHRDGKMDHGDTLPVKQLTTSKSHRMLETTQLPIEI